MDKSRNAGLHDGDSSLHHRGLEDREQGSFNPRDA